MSNKQGFLFWITGFSGSGKTEIAKNVYKFIKKNMGPTILVNGDELRNMFKLNDYSKNGRLQNSRKFTKLAKFITKQNINLVFAVVGMMNEPREWNRNNIKNYIEIYVESKVKKIVNFNKKKVYKKYKNNLVGVDIIPEYPKKPDIKVINNFDTSINQLSDQIIKKIKMRLKI